MRLPTVAGIVALAAGAATLRACAPSARTAPLSIVTASPPGARGVPGGRAQRPGAFAGTTARGRVVVYVVGKVVHGGVYTLGAGARAIDALHAAGGLTAGADAAAVNLAKPLVDGEELYFSEVGAATAASSRTRARNPATRAERPQRVSKRFHKKHSGSARGRASDGVSDGAGDGGSGAPDVVVDLNAADETTLETLPGIGPALAERIALVREQSGPFGSLDDLLDVGGMTQSKLDAITPYVTLH